MCYKETSPLYGNCFQIHIRQFSIRLQFRRLPSIRVLLLFTLYIIAPTLQLTNIHIPMDAIVIPNKFDHVSVLPKYTTEAKIIATRLNVLVIE